MKTITTLMTLALIFSSQAEASLERNMLESVRDEVHSFYANSGEWSLVKLKNIEEVQTDSREFVLWKAKAQIQNVRTARGKTETCLVTFVADNSELYGINCF